MNDSFRLTLGPLELILKYLNGCESKNVPNIPEALKITPSVGLSKTLLENFNFQLILSLPGTLDLTFANFNFKRLLPT